MLYLALPPTPSPVVSILQTTTQNNGCESLQLKSQKSDLANKLLGKILASSVSTKPCATENNNTVNIQSNRQKNKPAKSLATFPPVSTSSKQSLPITQNSTVNKQAAIESEISPVPLEKTSRKQQSESQNKSIDKNAIGRILAKVQELINVSLYASIKNSIGDTVEPQIQSLKKPATRVSNSGERTNKQNLEENTSNTTNKKVASNTNINTAKILAVVQKLITASISASLNNAINYSVKTGIQSSGEIALYNLDRNSQINFCASMMFFT